MKYLKEYRFDSQDNNRGILGALFDIEEHLTLTYMSALNAGIQSFSLQEQGKGLTNGMTGKVIL